MERNTVNPPKTCKLPDVQSDYCIFKETIITFCCSKTGSMMLKIHMHAATVVTSPLQWHSIMNIVSFKAVLCTHSLFSGYP